MGLAVLGFWLLMMGLLLHREYGGAHVPQSSRAAAAQLSDPDETWLELLVEEQPVGRIHLRRSAEKRHGSAGVMMTIEACARLDLLGSMTELELRGGVWRSSESRRADFDFAVASGDYDLGVAGRWADGMLRAEVSSAGETVPVAVPVDEELVFSSGFGTLLELPALAVGEEVRLAGFDPLTLQKSPMRVRCVAEETLQIDASPVATRRLEVIAGGIRSRAWIDASGEVVQMKTPFGLTLRRVGPGSPSRGENPSPPGARLLRLTAVAPSGEQPHRGARTMVLRLVSKAGKAIPEDRSQQSLGGDTYRVTAAEPPGSAAAAGPELAPFLQADAFVQSDHPKIRRQAATIVGDETDPWRRAVAIHQWVFTTLRKEPVASVPSALEVLQNGRGDCNEHTVLFTALARAASLPARIDIGLVWSDDLAGFYYHAWPEVWVGEWVRMDPTLGQPLADATHVKLLTGGIESWTGILAHLGQLEIEVLAIE